MSGPLRTKGADLLISVHAQPGASKSQIVGLHGEALKIKIKAPPVDGKANIAIAEFLAETLGVAKSAVSLESGRTGHHKVFRVKNISLEVAQKVLGLA